MLHSVISPSVLQAVRVADILKRKTVLILPTNSHIWTPELVYLPGDIDSLIAQTLLESADNHNCIQNYLLSYKLQVTSTGAGNKVTSSNNDANTVSNGSVTDGLKVYTQNNAAISWNEKKKDTNLSDRICTESKGHTSKEGDTTFATTTSYNSGAPAETTATYTKQIQRNTAASYDQIPPKTKTASQIEIPVTNTTAHDNTDPGKGTLTYRWEVNENTNDTRYQKETMNKTTTTYRNIQSETAAVYRTKLQDAPTVDIKPATVKTTTTYQGKRLVKNTIYLSDFRVERTTNDDLDKGTNITEFVTARNQPKTTNDDLDDREKIAEFVTARNLPKTTKDDLDDGKAITEFVTARNLLKTSDDNLDDRKTITEFVTARNLLKTTKNDLDDRKTITEFVTARNQPKTTNDDLDDREKITEFVTAKNLLKTTKDDLDDRKTITEFATARNLLKTTNDDLDDGKTITEFVTARNLLKTTNDDLEDGKTITEFATARNLLKTTEDDLDDRKTVTEFATARNLPKTTNDDLDDGKTITEFVTARNLLKTTKDDSDDRETIAEFVTARNLPKTTKDDLDDRKTITEFVTAGNLLNTSDDDLYDRKTITEFVTASNLPKTTNDDLDDGKTITEFTSVRNLSKTTKDDLDDGKTITEFVTARNLLKTTNDGLEDTTTTTEFVTAWKLLQTVVYGLHVGKTQATYANAWNLLKTTTSISSDSTTDRAYLTPMDVFQRSTESLKGNATKPELVTTKNVLHTVTGNLTDITHDIEHDIRATPFEEPSGGLRICEELAACKGTKIQLEVTTSSPGGTSGSLETVDITETQFECSNCLVPSATQSVSDLIQVSSPLLKDKITTSADDLANQSLLVTTSSSNEPTGNTGHDTMTEVKSDAKGVTHFNVSNQAMPVTEESLSNVNNASHATLDKDEDIFGQTTEHTQAVYNSTSADIFEIMEQMVNSTISPAELLTLQILYELLLSKYEAAGARDDTETPGDTNTTLGLPQNGVSSEIRNTINVLEHISGIMDNRILDNVTDEEINSLREAVEYVWYIVRNDSERNINRSLVKTYQGADHSGNRSTPRLMPEIKRKKSKRQTTEVVLGQQAEIHKFVGSPLGFIIRNVSYNDKNRLEKKISSLVTGNAITD